MTCSSLRGGIILSGFQVIPSSRCGALVAGLDLELAVDPPDPRVEFERDRLVAGEQVPAHAQGVALQDDRVGDELHTRVVLGVEELGRAQVLIALGVAGLDVGGVDRQLDRRVRAQVEPALVTVEMALDGRQAPEVPDAELDARALRVQLPAADKGLVGAMVGKGLHGGLLGSSLRRVLVGSIS